MIQRKKKRIGIIIICLIAILITTGTILTINNNNNKIIAKSDALDFSAKELVVETEKELEETYDASSVTKLYGGSYIIKYDTEEQTQKAYERFIKDENIKNVYIDNAKIELLDNINLLTIKKNIYGQDFESWGIYTMGLNETQSVINNKSTKNNVVVAVIDSGFDLTLNELDDYNFTNRIDDRYINITNNSRNISDNYEVTDQSGNGVFTGHGTHIGGIILDGTPDNVKILPIKVEDNDKKVSSAYITAAIRYAIDANVDVINMSLGMQNPSEVVIQQTQELVNEAISKGIVVVAAVGNGDANGIRINGKDTYPAATNGVIGVGALKTNIITLIDEQTINLESYVAAKNSTKDNLTYTTFSNYGSIVDYAAPGEYIFSIVPRNSIYYDSLGVMSGTSQSTPHIAAAAATMKSYDKSLNSTQIDEILQYYAIDLGTEGKDTDYGYGMPCFKNYTECTCGDAQCDRIYCFGCNSQSCIFHTQQTKTLDYIEITRKPDKKIYEEDEEFDPTNMVVTAVYNDNSREIVTDYTYSPNGKLKTTDTKITVTYLGKTAEVTITVNPKQTTPQVVLEGIEITKMPDKKTYTEEESFDPTGMIVKAVYSDNSKVTVTDYTYTPNGKLKTTDTKITVTYLGKTADVTITVNPKQTEPEPEVVLERIEITKMPDKMTYTEGENFDSTGMIVKAFFSDGTSQEIDLSGSNWPTNMQAGSRTITITYTYGDKTESTQLTVTINAKQTEPEPEVVLEKIEVTTKPNKTTYVEGEYFDPTGIVVVAYYSDGSNKTIDNYSCFPTTPLTTSNNIATIRYTENGKTVTKTVPISVEAKNSNTNNNNSDNNQGQNNTTNTTNNQEQSNTTNTTNNQVNNTQQQNTNNQVNRNNQNQTNSNTAATNTNSTTKNATDNTVKNENLAYTGEREEAYLIIGAIVIIGIGIIGFKKYKEYKDV